MNLFNRRSPLRQDFGAIYDKAADLIERDGFTHGPEGWVNLIGAGWCLEGALFKAMGRTDPRAFVRWWMQIDPAYTYLLNYLNVRFNHPGCWHCNYRNTTATYEALWRFNDRHSKHQVLRLLREAAEQWRQEHKPPERHLSLVPDTVPDEWVAEEKKRSSALLSLAGSALSVWLF